MIVRLEFDAPVDMSTPGVDELRLSFPFRVVSPQRGALLDEVTQHRFIVEISDSLLREWGYGSFIDDPYGSASALFEYVKKEAMVLLVRDRLADTQIIRIRQPDDVEGMPFDPSKLEDPTGKVLEIDLEEERLRMKELTNDSPIGFKINSASED